ncbi:MAG: putative acetyltransferase [Psychromonas sp.]|jgi:predicted acetyltransferase|uniref:GNAT family N-acetyltransferase n=1 Tax=Psychromonas sp. TaxID=1884585 RepID=UPI0039E2ABA8
MEVTKVDIRHLDAFKVYADECINDGLALYDSAENAHEVYLKKRIAYAQGRELPEGWPPISMFFCIESGVILGAIRIRRGTTDYIENIIGQIGYETLPKARGRGIATFMLNWMKKHIMKDACIVSCDADNLASRKVIEKSGGQFLSCFYSQEEGREVLRYQLKPAQ